MQQLHGPLAAIVFLLEVLLEQRFRLTLELVLLWLGHQSNNFLWYLSFQTNKSVYLLFRKHAITILLSQDPFNLRSLTLSLLSISLVYFLQVCQL